MHKQNYSIIVLLFGVFSLATGLLLAQDDSAVDCSPEGLSTQVETLSAEFSLDGDDSAANLFRLGASLQDLSLQCGYSPSIEEIDSHIEQTLMLAPLSRIIAVSAVGTDVDEIMAELETVEGDSFNGQLLYNGIEMGLDGAALGCIGCHNVETAPTTEGMYTRVDEIRLLEPQFADYDVTRYFVESILHPQAYIVPGYEAVVMSANFGLRLDLQQLADLITYLESQDQLEDFTINQDTDAVDGNNNLVVLGPEDCTISSDCVAGFGTIQEIAAAIGDGDAANGETLYTTLGCIACHLNGAVGPDTVGTWARVENERLPVQEGEWTAEEFVVTSIIYPNYFVPDPYAPNLMLPTFGQQLTIDDLADIVAYIRTQ